MVHLRNREITSVAGTQSVGNTRRVGNKIREANRNQTHRRPCGGGHRKMSALYLNSSEKLLLKTRGVT